MARLKDKYIQEVIPAMQKTRGYRNVMQVPRMVKIVVNMGINSTVEKDVIKTLVRDLATITGQMPVL
ncbi:MAG: 50S ribosomal protein L5, partial [Kiritimatiellae bacterium]|nr:50S ribosomal protein L5 [Kiritimatiellia bacterium]